MYNSQSSLATSSDFSELIIAANIRTKLEMADQSRGYLAILLIRKFCKLFQHQFIYLEH